MPKRLVFNVAKLALVFALLYWLVLTGKLQFSELLRLATTPSFCLISVAFWLCVPVGLGTWRWQTLLKGVGIQVPFLRTLQLQLIGFFFNTAMPGAVGGDIIKAVYIFKDHQGHSRAPAMLTVVLDRVLGLMGLFLMGFGIVLTHFSQLWDVPTFRPLLLLLFAGCAGILLVIMVIYMPYKSEDHDPFYRLLRLKIPGFSLLEKIYSALRIYKKKPSTVLLTLGVSVLIQSAGLLYIWNVTSMLNGQTTSLGTLALVFPFATLTTALPLAPGGLGVGHVAFEKLFGLVGVANGANVFNVYALMQLALNLTGIIPYLWTSSFFKSPLQASPSSGNFEAVSNLQSDNKLL